MIEPPPTNKLAAPEYDQEANPDRLSKVYKTPEELEDIVPTTGFFLHFFDNKTSSVCVVSRDGNKEPNDSGDSVEDGGQEETVVVPELGDEGGGSEGGAGAGDLVEDVLGGVRWMGD